MKVEISEGTIPDAATLPALTGQQPAAAGATAVERDETGGAAAVRAYLLGLLVSIAVALSVVLTTIGTQSALVPDSEGHSWPFRILFGPQPAGYREQGWTVLLTPGELTPEGLARLTSLLQAYLWVDVLLVGVYGVLLVAVARALCPAGPWRTVALLLLGTLVVVDLAENLAASQVVEQHGVLPLLLTLTAAKWGLAGLLGATLALRVLLLRPARDPQHPDRPTRVAPLLRRRLGQAATALKEQRFSYAPVLVIFVLSVPAGTAILEQLPDAQRQWIFDPVNGTRHAVAAVLATSVVGLALLALGRQRTLRALRHPKPEPGQDQSPQGTAATPSGQRHLLVWAVGPLLALVGAAAYALSGHGDLVLVPRLLIWVAVPALVALLSWGTAWVWRRHPTLSRCYEPPRFDREEAFAVGIAGTVAGVAALVVGGLSLVRAFTPLLVLPAATYVPEGGDPAAVRARVVGLLALAAAGVVLPWLAVIVVARRVGGPLRPSWTERHTPESSPALRAVQRLHRFPPLRTSLRRRFVMMLAAVSAFLALGCLPQLAAWVGLAATATLAFAAMAAILCTVALVLQERPTAEILRLARFQRTPLVTLLVLTVLLVGTVSGKGGLHEVDRGTPTGTADTRPTVDAAFATWLAGASRCEVRVGGYPVRPMLMLAAEGGGIRASYWTVRALQALDDATCAEYSTYFSGGASGGSVGLTVARFSGSGGRPDSRAAVDAVKAMAQPATLSRAADGTFVRDLLYGAWGVPLPTLGAPDPWAWTDRAGQIEDGWSASAAWGGQRFLADPATLSPATGALVVNSTSVKGNCRVWVSQLQLPSPAEDESPTFDPERSCDEVRGVATRTVDLFRAYGPFVPGADPGTCLGSVSAATAALLTARFPYVTPSGVVGPCPDRELEPGRRTAPYWPRTQLVDGGYIENSGLATITDLADVWLPQVRGQNDLALADRTRRTPLVVPVVVYLSNGDHDTNQPALGASPLSELAVPPATFLAAGQALDQDAALLGRARDAVELAGFCPTRRYAGTCARLGDRFRSRVVVVDRATQPEIGAPLGWVLSGASTTSLDKAVTAQLTTFCPANRPAGVPAPATLLGPPAKASCRPGYATLGDLTLALGKG